MATKIVWKDPNPGLIFVIFLLGVLAFALNVDRLVLQQQLKGSLPVGAHDRIVGDLNKALDRCYETGTNLSVELAREKGGTCP